MIPALTLIVIAWSVGFALTLRDLEFSPHTSATAKALSLVWLYFVWWYVAASRGRGI